MVSKLAVKPDGDWLLRLGQIEVMRLDEGLLLKSSGMLHLQRFVGVLQIVMQTLKFVYAIDVGSDLGV
jgi:hypothetical protein